MTKFGRTLILIVLAVMVNAQWSKVNGQGFTAHVGTVPGAYNFWFHAPAPPEVEDEIDAVTPKISNQRYPLLIFLHGRGLCGRDLAKVKRYGAIDAVARGRSIDCFIMAPQNPGESWNPHKIMKIVDWASKNYNVDTTRIYVYGMSRNLMAGEVTLNLKEIEP